MEKDRYVNIFAKKKKEESAVVHRGTFQATEVPTKSPVEIMKEHRTRIDVLMAKDAYDYALDECNKLVNVLTDFYTDGKMSQQDLAVYNSAISLKIQIIQTSMKYSAEFGLSRRNNL